jgi:ABC-type sugar transport system ATPase subunit
MIELSNVSFTYPSGVDALGGISLRVERGEFVVMCGPSGCGKSTLLMTINGLSPHSVEGRLAGRVSVAGWDTRETPVAELATVAGMVFQNPEAQISQLTVEDEIAALLITASPHLLKFAVFAKHRPITAQASVLKRRMSPKIRRGICSQKAVTSVRYICRLSLIRSSPKMVFHTSMPSRGIIGKSMKS